MRPAAEWPATLPARAEAVIRRHRRRENPDVGWQHRSIFWKVKADARRPTALLGARQMLNPLVCIVRC
jgi:hypothetical protein